MTSKKTPTIHQLLDAGDYALHTRPTQPRTIWNTRCGGYPAGELISIAADGRKPVREVPKKTARARAKAL